MVSPSIVVLALALFAFAAATDVQQCNGKSLEGLSNDVQLHPCRALPCKLKKGKRQEISITFTPDKATSNVVNRVTAKLISVDVPFIGVDGTTICEKILYTESGEKASCPLEAGTKYTYKDSFPILPFYPTLSTDVTWKLETQNGQELTCFKVPVRIV